MRGLEFSLGTPAPTTGELRQARQALLSHWRLGLWTEPSYTVMRPFLVSTSRDSTQHTPDALPQDGLRAGVTPYSAVGGGAAEWLGEAAHLAPSGLPLRHT